MLTDYQQYQQRLLTVFIRWLNRMLITISLVNSVWFGWHFGSTLLQNTAMLLLIAIGWWCRRLLRQEQTRRAARIYLAAGMGLVPLLVLSLEEIFIPYAPLGLALFLLLATYLEPQRLAQRWGVASLTVYGVTLSLRILMPVWEYRLPLSETLALYLFPLILLTSVTLLGCHAASLLNEAFARSEATRAEQERMNRALRETQTALQATNARLHVEDARHQRLDEQLLHLKKAIETIPIGITVIDLEGQIIYTNPAEAAMHGYRAEELIAQNVGMLAPPEYRKRAALEQVKQWQGLIRESVNIRKDGSRFPVWLMSEIVKGADGEPLAIVTSCEDITSRKQAEVELERHRWHLEELAEERTIELQKEIEEHKRTEAQLIQSAKLASIGQLAAGVAHELNQPLMVIRTSAQFMRRSIEKGNLTNERLLTYFEPIERNTKRMMHIINHLRIFSRQSQTAFTRQDVNQIITASFLMVEEQFRLHNIVVTTHYTAGLPAVRGDANQLEQVILNLLTNARDAIEVQAKNAPRRIDIQTQLADNLTYVEILISDSGSGIAPELLAKIFDPFFTTKEVGKGTGLGLAISYGIMQDHHGKIDVVKTDSTGTTFRMTLPVWLDELPRMAIEGNDGARNDSDC